MHFQEKINALETQNKTLAAQLRRLHQIVVNGGLRQGQTSTALMVLLLSTALFLIPGLGDKADSKNEIDIQSALKMPPMPGQSRSLLQFEGIERGANDIADMTDFQELKSEAEEVVEVKLEAGSSPPYSDHDYTFKYKYIDPMKTESGSAWIEEDAPPLVSYLRVNLGIIVRFDTVRSCVLFRKCISHNIHRAQFSSQLFKKSLMWCL